MTVPTPFDLTQAEYDRYLAMTTETAEMKFAAELRKWWSFDDGQRHTHTWHSREDFIETKLPALLAAYLNQQGKQP